MADVCDCGRVIEQPATGRRRSKCLICSPKRERPERHAPVLHLKGPLAAPSAAQATEPPARPTLAAKTLAELVAVSREDTSAGVAALALAELFDAGGYTAQGAAALVKAHREALAEATRDAAPEADIIDAIFGATG